jgi:hypothetical protein
LSLINISNEAAFGRVKISDALRIKIVQVSNGFRPGLGQLSDNSRPQNQLTTLEVRRAVQNQAEVSLRRTPAPTTQGDGVIGGKNRKEPEKGGRSTTCETTDFRRELRAIFAQLLRNICGGSFSL